jgi:hypothetical protein
MEPLTLSLIAAVAVGLTHGIAHTLAGDMESFDDAGVNAAGIAVVVGAFVATLMVTAGPAGAVDAIMGLF